MIVFVVAQYVNHMWKSLTASFKEAMISSATVHDIAHNIVVLNIAGHTDIT
jgi:hypothetical protein